MASGPVTTQRVVRFGDGFELDLHSWMLRRGDRTLKLERIPMQLLLLLVERRPEIVSRAEIVDAIWGKDVYLDTDNSINGAVRKIRQVLRDNPDQPRFIQTFPGKGYRFIAPVLDHEPSPEVNDRLESAPPLEQTDQVSGQNEQLPTVEPSSLSLARIRSRPAAIWIALSGALILITVLASQLWIRSRDSKPAAPRKVVLAVLPFENLTGDSSQEYFSDGITEEMITQLGNLDPQQLAVIARTSVMHYKGSRIPLDQVGRELGVQYVLEGSVRRDADRVRITAQLTQTKDQTHLWAREYDRESSGLLAIQSEIAREIADEIQLTLDNRGSTRQSADSHSLSPEAYESHDLYLRGQYFLNQRTAADLKRAIACFESATEKDPANVHAYAGMAMAYTLLGPYSGAPQAEFIPRARAAALKALELDESLPEAHTALALIVENYDWDWQTAEKEFRRAIQLNPNYATAHQWYAEYLMWRGRFEEALAESERARQLDPLSLIISADNGAILYFSRDYDRAIEKFGSVLEMDPSVARAHLIDAAYVEKQMYSNAIRDIQANRSVFAEPGYWAALAYVYGRSGQRVPAERALNELQRLDRREQVDPMTFAQAYAGMKENDHALAWLERAFAQHSHEMVTLKVAPAFDPLRGDPRFQDLLHRVRLDR